MFSFLFFFFWWGGGGGGCLFVCLFCFRFFSWGMLFFFFDCLGGGGGVSCLLGVICVFVYLICFCLFLLAGLTAWLLAFAQNSEDRRGRWMAGSDTVYLYRGTEACLCSLEPALYNNNNERISRAPFHVKHAQLR